MVFHQPPGPSAYDWASTPLQLIRIERADSEPIFELRKEMVINGVLHLHFVFLTRLQLRDIGIDHGL